MKYISRFLLGIVILFSCNDKQNSNMLELIKSDNTIAFTIQDNVKNKIITLFLYEDGAGKEYLTIQNQGLNEILFFNINTRKLEFRIKPEVHGPNGIGFMRGYSIKNLDSIFVATQGRNDIYLINKYAILKDRFNYDETDDKIPLYYSSISSFRYRPIVFVNNTMYIHSTCNRWAENNPVTATIDLNDKSVKALSGFQYPKFPNTGNREKKSGIEGDFSRYFNGSEFVYSFYFDENIYVANIDHTSVKGIKVKSKYIKQIGFLDDYGNLTPEDIATNPNYGNLIYDPYREVYYRVAYPETEIEKNINGLELLEYGRKVFSIIILDKDFNIIGETVFPEYIYNSGLMFVRKDGLYISNSHFMNPDFNDDVLSFQRFDLSNCN